MHVAACYYLEAHMSTTRSLVLPSVLDEEACGSSHSCGVLIKAGDLCEGVLHPVGDAGNEYTAVGEHGTDAEGSGEVHFGDPCRDVLLREGKVDDLVVQSRFKDQD